MTTNHSITSEKQTTHRAHPHAPKPDEETTLSTHETETPNASTDPTHEAAPHAATQKEEVPVTPAPSPHPAGSPDVAAIAKAAAAMLAQIAATLPFHDPSAKDLKAARVATLVPVAAMTTGATIVETSPDRFPGFDSTMRSAAEYVAAMTPIAVLAERLARRISRSVAHRHGQGASETLALYHVVTGMARGANTKDALDAKQALREQLVVTRKKRRATTVTQDDLKSASKQIRRSKVAAEKAREAAVVNAEAQAAADAAAPSPSPSPQPAPGPTPAAAPKT
jgi:hypothetical protein